MHLEGSRTRCWSCPAEVGARSPSLRTIGLGTNPHHIDDVRNAEEEIASLERGLAAWRNVLEEQATDEGRAILAEHALFAHFRSVWLTTRGRQALHEGRPHQAEAYLKAAIQDDRVQAPPSAWVLLGEIALRAGDSERARQNIEKILDDQPAVYSTLSTLESLVLTERRIAQRIAAGATEKEATMGEPAAE